MNETKKEIYYIQGMHCRSCELLIEENISKIDNVQKVNVSHSRGTAEVYYLEKKPGWGQIEKAIRDSGYSLGDAQQKKRLFSGEPLDYIELFFAAGILTLIYLWLKIFGAFNLNLSFGASPGLIVVGLIGLAAGISSCMALVGGIVLAISSRHAEFHPEAAISQKFSPHLFFNAGRVISYAVLGGLIGLIGSSFQFSNSLLGFLVISVGVVMFFLGLKLIEIFPALSGGLTLPKGLARMLGMNREQKEYSHRSAFTAGALTFFLPCGFTQAMQLYAMSTGSFSRGAAIMGIFALGTVPGLLGIGGVTAAIKGSFARYFFKFAGLVVIVLGLVNISNGFNLTGIKFVNSSGDASAKIDSEISDGIQTVRMIQSDGYDPDYFTIKKGIPVKWVITSTTQYSCSSRLFVPSLGIGKVLQLGENIINFIPTQNGTIKFTCSMGMYGGYFNVVN